MPTFQESLLLAAGKAERIAAEVHKKAALAGHTACIDNSRVYSGWLRAGHKFVLNQSPPTGSNPRPPSAKSGQYGYPQIPEDLIRSIKAGDTSVTYTTVPYAIDWETGNAPMYGPAKIASEDAAEKETRKSRWNL